MKKHLIALVLLLLITGCGKNEVNEFPRPILDINTVLKGDLAQNEIECYPVQLRFYSNGTYEFSTSYKAEFQSQINETFYFHTNPKKGKYKYDLSKITNGLERDNYPVENTKYKFEEIETGKKYIMKQGDNNKYLDELLKELNINLDICATEDKEDLN